MTAPVIVSIPKRPSAQRRPISRQRARTKGQGS